MYNRGKCCFRLMSETLVAPEILWSEVKKKKKNLHFFEPNTFSYPVISAWLMSSCSEESEEQMLYSMVA